MSASKPEGRPRGGRSRPLRALTSDLWFTLAYLRPPDRVALERRRERAWVRPLLAHGMTASGARDAVARLMGWVRARESAGRSPHHSGQVGWLARETGFRLDPDAILSELDAALLHAPVRLAPGALGALRALKARGVRLGLVSNVVFEGSAPSRAHLSRLGLSEAFDALYFSSEHPWTKPSPEPFRWTLGRLDCPPDQAVHVGDLGVDVAGARAAGMGAILYTGLHAQEFPRGSPRPPRPPGACLTVSSWRGVAAHARASTPLGAAPRAPDPRPSSRSRANRTRRG